MCGPDRVEDATHDLGQAEVLGREHRSDAHPSQRRGVAIGDDATDDDRQVTGAGCPETFQHLGNQLHVRARQDRKPDTVNVFGHRGGNDLLRCEPDSLVDDLEAGVARPHRDLFGAVAVPVQTGFSDEETQSGPELFTCRTHPFPDLRQVATRCRVAHPHRSGNPCGRSVFAEDVTQGLGPLAGGDSGASRLQ